jgi:hypothetical protein
MEYNPYDINITHRNLYVCELIPKIDFTNSVSNWDNIKNSLLLESIMIGIPIDSFFINAAISFTPNKWTIINGNKRLLALKRYIDGVYQLEGLDYLHDMDGKYFDEIPRYCQRRLQETRLMVHTIDTGTPREVYDNICSRVR